MLFLLTSIALSATNSFILRQTLWPPSENELGLFGRAVAFSHDRVAVGSEYLDIEGWKFPEGDNRIGAVYVYDYDAATNKYTISKGNNEEYNRIEPKNDTRYPGVIPGTFSSRMMLSDDGETLIVGAPYTWIPKDMEGLTVVEGQNAEEDEAIGSVNGVDYYKEIGAIYVFKRNADGSWKQTDISIPKNILYRGGYGRALSGTSDLSRFAGAYYNKFKSSIKKIGGVSVEDIKNGNVENQMYISPPDELTDKTKQRFGSTVDFYGRTELYISTTTQGDSGKSGVYYYTYNSDKWEKKEKIEANGSENYKEFGLSAAFRIHDTDALIAIYAENSNTDNAVFIMSRGESGWNKEPQQIIRLGGGDLSEKFSDMFFCSQGENNFLTIILDINDEPVIQIFSQSPSTKLYELFQTIKEPKISRYSNITYENQSINFASDFAWDTETCSKFVVGAMSKYGQGMKSTPDRYSRSYVYELVQAPDKSSSSNTGVIVGCVFACVAIIALVVVVVIFIRRKNSQATKINNDEV